MGWTITHNTSEPAALDLIRSRSKPPVGIIFISSNDNTIKTIATAISSHGLGTHPHVTYDVIMSSELASLPQDVFEVNHFAIVNLLGGLSSQRHFRHEAVQELRQRGAKTIIMVWIKGNLECDNLVACAIDEALHQNPPTIDGLDYLFTMEP